MQARPVPLAAALGAYDEYEAWLAEQYGVYTPEEGTPTFQAEGKTVAGCPANADAWQTSQNGYCADSYGWPLRPDGSVLTRKDIEQSAVGSAVKDYWPYAAGALILLFVVGRR